MYINQCKSSLSPQNVELRSVRMKSLLHSAKWERADPIGNGADDKHHYCKHHYCEHQYHHASYIHILTGQR